MITLTSIATALDSSHAFALEAAISDGLTICKYADPVDDARVGLTAVEAREVLSVDGSLLYFLE